MNISELYTEVARYGDFDPEYYVKQMHPLPSAQVVDRLEELVSCARGKVVLDVGCTGTLSEALRGVASRYHGLNNTPVQNSDNFESFHLIDLDRAIEVPTIAGLDLIIAGEIIEHLSNPGHFLDLLKIYARPIIITTPNAFSAVAAWHIRSGIENVNREHVAWYSYHTLKTLIERHGYKVIEWDWYNGKPLTAEGLIFKLESVHG